MNTMEVSRNDTMARAKLVSNIFHPWAVLAPVLAVAAYHATGNFIEGIGWTLAAYLPAIIFPLLYAKARATVLSRGGIQHKISRSLVRNEPKQLFIMAFLFGIPSILILHFFNGPGSLLAIMLGCTAVMFVIAMINLKYRASFHLSMVTSMLLSLYFLFGPVSLISLPLLPVIGLSRYQLGEHKPDQIAAGFLIGLVVGGSIFFGMGLAA
ncbi:MAG: hypothetical protein AAC990_04440 [Dehalococcoides mccartyi]|uniref:PAP2 family protein n=1 Tax=Dehalococcoides mccartyi TaxID=61435 RepID=A0AB38Z7X9_9CHLR|nr:hypothetical protein [Dehalococcoides mccartyi]WRO06686.1 hypothetical protein VLL09_04670 [Dehalococcoides mccartyi]